MVGMERNANLVTMEAYAPLFTRVDPDGMQWPVDLLGYNSINAYGSPSYYMQGMFSTYHGDEVLSITAKNIPTKEWQPPSGFGIGPLPAGGGAFGSAKRGASRQATPPAAPPEFLRATGPRQSPAPIQLPLMSFDSTRDSKTGTIFIKVVNRGDTAQSVHFTLSGGASINATGRSISLSGSSPEETNSIAEPQKMIPVVAETTGLGADFTHSFAPYSVNILEMKTSSGK
jgi:alpha-N-arabinofuranosidase